MSGKPARQGDMTQYGGPALIKGSAGVRIGAPHRGLFGVPRRGDVRPSRSIRCLGAKVLPSEVRPCLPGPLPFILSTFPVTADKNARAGRSLGPGWKMPADIRLQLRDNTLILIH